MGSGGSGNYRWAKLLGEDFRFYMRGHSIILGRGTDDSAVDVDLTLFGGGKNISRRHARIFYDFECSHFALEVLSKNGCLVKGVYCPKGTLVKLYPKYCIQIGDLEFFFLPRKGNPHLGRLNEVKVE